MKSGSYKILFYTKDPNGGTGRLLEYLQEQLLLQKIPARIITHAQPKGFSFEAALIGQFSPKLQRFSLVSAVTGFSNILGVKKCIEEYCPDVIVSLDIYANIITILLKPFFPTIKIVQSTNINLVAHTTQERNPILAVVLQKCISFFYKYTDVHFVPSRELKDQLINTFGLSKEHVVHVPYFISVDKCQTLSRKVLSAKYKKLFRENDIKIFSMGRFEAQKDFEALILAVSQQFYEDKISLYLLGDGSQKKDLIKLCRENNIKNVHFLGWQKNPYTFLKYADVFVFLSHYEAFPYTLIEVLSLGVPIIASDIDFGPRELFGRNKYGLLLQNNKTETIVSAIQKLVSNKSLRDKFANNAARRAKDFDGKAIFPVYLKLFDIPNNSSDTK